MNDSLSSSTILYSQQIPLLDSEEANIIHKETQPSKVIKISPMQGKL